MDRQRNDLSYQNGLPKVIETGITKLNEEFFVLERLGYNLA